VCLNPTFIFLAFLPEFSISSLIIEHTLIIDREAWHKREHVLFCAHAQSAKLDRQTDELPLNDQMLGSLPLAPNYLLSVVSYNITVLVLASKKINDKGGPRYIYNGGMQVDSSELLHSISYTLYTMY
jgi:hypothetical protein